MRYVPSIVEMQRLEKLRRGVVIDKLTAQGVPVSEAIVTQILRQIDDEVAGRIARRRDECTVRKEYPAQQQSMPQVAIAPRGTTQRRYARWYLPAGVIVGEIQTPYGLSACTILDVGLGGVACAVDGHNSFVIDNHVTVRLLGIGITLDAKIRYAGGNRIGLEVVSRGLMPKLLSIAKEHKAVTVRSEDQAGVAKIEGFLGFRAFAAFRTCRAKPKALDLAMATGIDHHGIGVLLLHLERGGVVQGCPDNIRSLLKIAKVCGERCICPKAGQHGECRG